jgi:hypothetical protein
LGGNKEVVMFKEHANPVGEPHRIEEVEKRLQFYKDLWDSQKSRSFWRPRVSLSGLTNFLMAALDDMVIAVGAYILSGPDKKATVLDAIDRLYDYTVREALPFWVRPFAAPVKNYIVYVLASNAIDWMVAKYQSGSWGVKETALNRFLVLTHGRDSNCRAGRCS